MTDSLHDLFESAGPIPEKLDFPGHDLLPQEVVECWEALPPAAKAVAVLSAQSLRQAADEGWERLGNDR